MERNVVKKYITFSLMEQKPKTTRWTVFNNKSGEALAMIYWYPAWRQYVVETLEGILFNDGCLRDIIEFLQGLNLQQRKSVQNVGKVISDFVGGFPQY